LKTPGSNARGGGIVNLRGHGPLGYRLELWVIRLRDLLRPPGPILVEAGVREGMTILDFGCGPGGFSLAAARIVGPKGRVFAFDIQPRALEFVLRKARRLGLGNVEALHGSRLADVSAASVDMALLYDVLHGNPGSEWTGATLAAIHRVLKPAGFLSVRDHHLDKASLVSLVTGGSLFRHSAVKSRSFVFRRSASDGETT
jgi:ubiquinone/menaquinone biosynthesis C-methylase UbiE